MPDRTGGGGDKHLPDTNAENIPQPKVGQIWRQDFEKFPEPGFFKVMKIQEITLRGATRTEIHIRRISKETKQTTGAKKEIKEAPLIFLKKYTLVAENEEEWSPLETSSEEPAEKIEEAPGAPTEDEEKEPPEEQSSEPEEETSAEPDPESPIEEDGHTNSEENQELTSEQKKRREIGERLELAPEQLTEREELEKKVDEARADYVSSLYQHEQKLLRVLSILSLKKNPEPDEQYKNRYTQALKNLQAFDLEALKGYRTRTNGSLEGYQQSEQSYLERYNRLEGLALWTEQQEIRAVQREAHLDHLPAFGKKILDKVSEPGVKYQKLPLWNRLLVSGSLVGIHVAAVAVSGPAALGLATLWLGAKGVTGAAAYKSTSKWVEQGAQLAGDKLENRKDKKEVKKALKKAISGESEDEGKTEAQEYFNRLNAIALKNIESVDKKLAAYERRSFLAKAASLTLIFGMPAGRYLGDLFGSGAEAVNSSLDVPPPQDTLEATDTPEAPVSMRALPVSEAGEASVPAEAGLAIHPEALGTTAIPSLEAVTVTEADSAKGLWGMIESQLPENMPDGEQNRVTASIENLITNKIQGLTEVEIQERYGLSSKDISLIKAGDVIKLDALVSQQELQEIINGKTVLTVEVVDTEGVGEGASAAEAGPTSVPVLEPGQGHPDVIGFKDTPLTAEEQHWIDIRNKQGLFTEADEMNREEYEANGEGYEDADSDDRESSSMPSEEASKESLPQFYSYEESQYQNLPAEQRLLWRENMTLLRGELLDINHTEFGPEYTPTHWQADQLWALNKGNSMQDIIAFDNPRFNYDPRDHYRDWQEQQIGRRGIYLPPMHPEPQLGDGPDAYANHTMDTIKDEYRHNLSEMQRAALAKFGNAAYPIGRAETVQQYMTRIATLYTRARLEDPHFRLKF